MKKTLLGTTALVSAGLIAGPALASDPLAVTVSGSVVTGFYVIDQDNIGATKYNDSKVAVVARNIDINAEGTLDNGLVAGALAKMQLGNDEGRSNPTGNDTTFSELYAYLEGGFGRVELGGTDGAAFKMHYTSPWFVPGNGVDSPNIYNMTNGVRSFSARTSTFSLMAEDENKVSYFTPRIGGVQLGVSYTPDVTINDPSANGFGVAVDGANVQNVFELAGNYAGDFSGLQVGVDGFYVGAEAPNSVPGADPEEYGFGINLGLAGFTLGGAWYESTDIAAPANAGGGSSQFVSFVGDEKQVWTIGLSYGTGPWVVGVSYLEAQVDSLNAAVNGAENSFLQVGGGYSLGAGVDIGLDIQILSDQANSAAPSIDSNSAGLVLAIAF